MKVLSLILFVSLNAFAMEYKQVGTYLLEYSIFKIDVYQITYFKNGQSEKLELVYKTDVKKKYSQEGWRVGLKHLIDQEDMKEKINWLLDNSVDVKSGDKLSIIKTDDRVQLFKNDILLAQVQDKVIARLAFEPWLGEKPVSEELKKSLLNI
ncbi:MAG: hypothetical protein OHK0056_30220 [Bacteriovoracaceae bacterium]